MEQHNVTIQKIVFLGAIRVGKSTIVKILTQKFNFNSKDYEMTQGVELYDKALDVCGHTVDTVLIDTAGHELYKWIVRPICDENAFYALCFDLTNKDSLDIIKGYLEELNIQRSVLIGCKFDLQSRHAISLSAAEEFAVNNNLKLHLTSTRTTSTEMEELFYSSIMDYDRDVTSRLI
ncbi:Intraflagellar transport protein [Dirofilaria immitis]